MAIRKDQERASIVSVQSNNMKDSPNDTFLTEVKRSGRVFYPIGYGADPTGVADSSDAILSALQDAFQVQNTRHLLPGINDLGGVVIDLQGGDYKITKPIRFPSSGGGNLVIEGGTLRASDTFPKDGYLIELHHSSSARLDPAATLAGRRLAATLGVYYEDITFRDILFDASFRGGGLLVVASVRTRVDHCFFNHFVTDGILVEGGHETFISSSFLGQHMTIGGDPRERYFSGTAINLASNDNAVTDVAVFSAAVGLLLRGQANILTGVHCYNKATFWGGVGILVKLPGLSQTRLDNCYMDFTAIVLEDPVQVTITNGFFLGDANVVLRSVKGEISGLTIVDNMFSGGSGGTPIVKLDESKAKFGRFDQVVIDRNVVTNMALKSTVGRLTVVGNGTRWSADFGPLLVFPDLISHVEYSLLVRNRTGVGLPAHAVTGVGNNTVVVEANEAVDGVVSVVVDQYFAPGEKKIYG
ncbi:polygalacturonase QRT3 [Typha angustifolia]|uniref:polygalacturonase QRT3 n=1 Tax=Typha angustifolia TaxID=59011 RepID=UPI003C2C02F8